MFFYGGETYYLAEFLIQRGLGLTYFFAFLVIFNQYVSLVGENGILPVGKFVGENSFRDFPSLFFLFNNNLFLRLSALTGLILSFTTFIGVSELFGSLTSFFVWTFLWVLLISFYNTGQRFFSQGKLLIEAGFLAIFLGGMGTASSEIVIWLFRWLLFRLMFNSGLGKIRGDEKWRNLTAFKFNLETQPFPGPLSWKLYHLPDKVLKMLTVFGLFSMLIVPFFYFAPQPFASIAGIITIIYQLGIILSGNYSWLNTATISISFSTISDQVINNILGSSFPPTSIQPYPFEFQAVILAVVIAGFSINTLLDMIKSHTSEVYYGSIPIVNTYCKFTDIRKERIEYVIQGTRDQGSNKQWKNFRYQVSPPKLTERPKQYSPYNHRLDYQIWNIEKDEDCQEYWFEKLMKELLKGNEDLLKLFSDNPFPEKGPTQVRAVKYKYEFTSPETGEKEGVYWSREKKKVVHEPLKLDNIDV